MGEANAESVQNKQVFTPGEAASICQVSQQTIIRCFDAGRLKGFRVPGSRFRRIPREELARFMTANGIPLERLGRLRRRVLIVDDDPRIVELLVEVLERDGRFEVRTASTGYEAGIATHAFRPDLILLDCMLPDVNGNIVCRTLREDPRMAATKVLIVSGVVNQEQVQRLLESGADDFIKKPFNIERLVERIGQLLELG